MSPPKKKKMGVRALCPPLCGEKCGKGLLQKPPFGGEIIIKFRWGTPPNINVALTKLGNPQSNFLSGEPLMWTSKRYCEHSKGKFVQNPI